MLKKTTIIAEMIIRGCAFMREIPALVLKTKAGANVWAAHLCPDAIKAPHQYRLTHIPSGLRIPGLYKRKDIEECLEALETNVPIKSAERVKKLFQSHRKNKTTAVKKLLMECRID